MGYWTLRRCPDLLRILIHWQLSNPHQGLKSSRAGRISIVSAMASVVSSTLSMISRVSSTLLSWATADAIQS